MLDVNNEMPGTVRDGVFDTNPSVGSVNVNPASRKLQNTRKRFQHSERT